jgi:hypothetical protein
MASCNSFLVFYYASCKGWDRIPICRNKCSPQAFKRKRKKGLKMAYMKLKLVTKKNLYCKTQIIKPTRCNSFTSLLLDVYVWLKMFWASTPPPPRAIIRSIRVERLECCWSSHGWSSWRVGGRGLPDHDQRRSNRCSQTVKPEAPSAVVCSWWWAE